MMLLRVISMAVCAVVVLMLFDSDVQRDIQDIIDYERLH